MSIKEIAAKIVVVIVLSPFAVVFGWLLYYEKIKPYCHRDTLFFLEEEQIYVRTQRDVDREFARLSFGKTKMDLEKESDYVVVDRYKYEEMRSLFIIQRNSDTIFYIAECNERAIKEIKCTHFHIVNLPSKVFNYAYGNTGNRRIPPYCHRFLDNPENYCAYYVNWKSNDYLRRNETFGKGQEIRKGTSSKRSIVRPL